MSRVPGLPILLNRANTVATNRNSLICNDFLEIQAALFNDHDCGQPAFCRFKSKLGIKAHCMRVELALFDGDALLERMEIVVGASERIDAFRLFRASHKVGPKAATIVLDNFADPVALKNAKLRMPIHESDDWESIQLEKYTLAFWCRLDA